MKLHSKYAPILIRYRWSLMYFLLILISKGGVQNGNGASIGSVAPIHSQLLPIRTVGVQGDCRTYSYVAALSSDREPCTASEWSDIGKLATIIPRVCHKINRLVRRDDLERRDDFEFV